MSDRPIRNRRTPTRADEVVSLAFLPHTGTGTAESSPSEPVATATVTTLGVPLRNSRIERLWAEALQPNAGEPIAVERSSSSESGDSTDPGELDEDTPGLDSAEDSSEDEGRDGAVPAAEDRATTIAPVASLAPIVPLATRPRAPVLQASEEGAPLCLALTLRN